MDPAGVFLKREKESILFFGLGLAEADDALALFPLTALLEKLDAFEPLQYGALGAGSG